MSVTARGCVFFYGHKKGEHWCFSQFAEAEFYDEDGQRYTCAEQFMMASKARVMGDEKTLASIMACDYNPTAIKALGRHVKPWDEEKWAAVRSALVRHGNFLKFSQNKALRKTLLGSGDLTLVEAAPSDRIWGIGVSVRDAAAGAKWKGLNLLGKALMETRELLANGGKSERPTFGPAEPAPKRQRSGEKQQAGAAGTSDAPDAMDAGAAPDEPERLKSWGEASLVQALPAATTDEEPLPEAAAEPQEQKGSPKGRGGKGRGGKRGKGVTLAHLQ